MRQKLDFHVSASQSEIKTELEAMRRGGCKNKSPGNLTAHFLSARPPPLSLWFWLQHRPNQPRKLARPLFSLSPSLPPLSSSVLLDARRLGVAVSCGVEEGGWWQTVSVKCV